MRFLILWSLLLAAGAVQAQLLNDSTLQCVSYWDLDEAHIYQVVQSKERITENDTVKLQSVSFKARVSVVDSTQTDYTMLWHYYDYQVDQADSLTRMLVGLAGEMDVIYTISDLGAFKALKNAVEIREFMYRGIDSVAAMYASVPGMDAVMAQLKQTFASPEAIQNSAIDEILLFHRLMGEQFETGEVYRSQASLPNIYGGQPFDAVQQAEVYEVDPEESTAIIRVVTDVDQKQARAEVFNYVVRMAQTMGVPAPSESDVPELTIQMRYAANMHLPSGWPLYIISVKDVTSGNDGQVDTVEMTLLE